jgi:hypothetical protein
MSLLFNYVHLYDISVTDDDLKPIKNISRGWNFEKDGQILYRGNSQNVYAETTDLSKIINSLLKLTKNRIVRGSILYTSDTSAGIHYGVVYFYEDEYKITIFDAEASIKATSENTINVIKL